MATRTPNPCWVLHLEVLYTKMAAPDGIKKRNSHRVWPIILENTDTNDNMTEDATP